MLRGQITITSHARLRLQQRVQNIPPKNYTSFVSAARYNGVTLNMLGDEKEKYCSGIHLNNSEQARIYSGYVFIFGGKDHKARTLITVYKIE